MYLANIDSLKRDLLADQVSEYQAFNYFFIFFAFGVAVSELFSYLPMESPTFWDYAQSVVLVVVPICGTYFAFQANGAEHGQDFFKRYFMLLWVLGIRFAGFAMAISVWSLLITLYWSEESGLSRPRSGPEVMAWTIWLCLFYRQLSWHFRQLKQNSTVKPL